MEPRVRCIPEDSPTIHFLCTINPIPRIDTYFFNTYVNFISNHSIGLSKGLSFLQVYLLKF